MAISTHYLVQLVRVVQRKERVEVARRDLAAGGRGRDTRRTDLRRWHEEDDGEHDNEEKDARSDGGRQPSEQPGALLTTAAATKTMRTTTIMMTRWMTVMAKMTNLAVDVEPGTLVRVARRVEHLEEQLGAVHRAERAPARRRAVRHRGRVEWHQLRVSLVRRPLVPANRGGTDRERQAVPRDTRGRARARRTPPRKRTRYRLSV